eukprot:12899258-Alexandrium_andersonii.AAC.1
MRHIVNGVDTCAHLYCTGLGFLTDAQTHSPLATAHATSLEQCEQQEHLDMPQIVEIAIVGTGVYARREGVHIACV